MKIMNFESWKKYLYLRESIKDDELDRILDKISNHEKLTDREQEFLSKFDTIKEEDLKDSSHLTKNDAYDKIKSLLDMGKKVICDLYDRDGKINDQIISIENNLEDETSTLFLKHNDRAKLYDRFLYNIKYDFSKDSYSLTSQDEYFEKIPINDED